MPREILQRIADDLDTIIGPGQDARIVVENKFQGGFAVARMEIVRTIYDGKNQPQPLKRVVWQSSIEPDSGVLALYRSHSGIALEDTLLDQQKEPWQRELFVPACTGLTFFRIEIPQGETLVDKWSDEKLPPAVTITLSFAKAYKTSAGTYDVPEEEKLSRTIVIGRTRKPTFVVSDINVPAEANAPTDANTPAKSDSGGKGSSQPNTVTTGAAK